MLLAMRTIVSTKKGINLQMYLKVHDALNDCKKNGRIRSCLHSHLDSLMLYTDVVLVHGPT